MRRLGPVLLVLTLLALPPASAGHESDPEIASPREKRDPSGDLLAVWLEHHEDGLKVTFKIAAMGARDWNRVYSVDLRIDGERYSPAVGLDNVGRVRTDSGDNPSGWGSPRHAARVDDRLLHATLRRGEPTYLSVVVPWGLYPGLEPGAEVEPLGAGSAVYDFQVGRWLPGYDTAPAQKDAFLLSDQAARAVLPIVVPAWVLPAIVVGATLAGAGGGLGTAWMLKERERRKKEEQAARAKRRPPETKPPEPRPIRLDPRTARDE